MKFLIKSCLVYLALLYSLAYMISAESANNSIYITQSGGATALTMNIDQIGNSNVGGTTRRLKRYRGYSCPRKQHLIHPEQYGGFKHPDSCVGGNG